jgi:hypothetical protein
MNAENPAAELLAKLGHAPGPVAWDLGGSAERVPMARWGKDHWTTLAYVETCWVDHKGMIEHDRMRCDRTRHPVFYSAKRRVTAFGTDADGARFPTRLKTEQPGADGTWGTVELAGHDDYDCLADLISEGLVEVAMPVPDAGCGLSFLDAWGNVVRMPDGTPATGRDGRAFRGERIDPQFVTGFSEMWLMTAASYSLTESGRAVAYELRACVARTRRAHQFIPSAVKAA